MNKKKIQLSIALFSILLIISPAFADDCTWTPSDIYGETFETNLLSQMANIHAPSLAFSVLNGTEVFYTKGFGEQPETDNAYHLMSASKMFTATAILQLYEQGLIGMNDDFNDYLPYELENPYFPSSRITIRHLLSHRSSLQGTIRGLLDYWTLVGNNVLTFPSCIYEFFHENGSYYSADNWENWEPGTSYAYSDVGFDILTLILENITETPFDTYVSENIFTPLGMSNTKHSVEDYSPGKLVTAYNWNVTTETNEIVPYLNNTQNPGGGGYFSTVEDMAKYMLMHLNNGESNGVSILNATTTELMHTEIGTNHYGLGWQKDITFGSRNDYQGHYGGPHFGYFSANFIRQSLGLVLLLNQGSWDLDFSDFSDICANILNLAHILLNPKCPEESNLYILPVFAALGLMVYIVINRKKK